MMGHYENRQETERRIVAILPEVAAFLNNGAGHGWRQDDADEDGDREWRRRQLSHEDGRRLTFYAEQNGKGTRIGVSGSWPQTGSGSQLTPRYCLRDSEIADKTTEITVSGEKTPEQIARDVARRLLPDYSELFGKLRDVARQRDDHRAQVIATANRIADALGARRVDEDRLPGEVSSLTIHPGKLNVYEVRVYGDSASVEISSLPVSQVLALVEWLKANGGGPCE